MIETKKNSRYFIGCLDDFIRLLVLILPKISGYVKDQNGDKYENNSNRCLSV